MRGEIMEEKIDDIKEIIEVKKAKIETDADVIADAIQKRMNAKSSIPKIITVDTGALNVREDFSMESPILTVIHKDEVFPILETSAEWWKIQVGDIVGWCRKEFTR